MNSSKQHYQRNLSMVIAECFALLRMSLSSIWQSKWSSLCIIGCIMLMVAVQATFLGMAEGFQTSLRAAGADDIVIIVDKQSKAESSSRITREQVELLRHHPLIARSTDTRLFSPEFRMTVSVLSRDAAKKMNVPVRGITEAGIALRDGFNVSQGRLPVPGKFEVVVGASLAGRVKGADVGSTLNLGGKDWLVVGHFTLANPVFETEFWADLGMVQAAYQRENQIQSVRIGFLPANTIAELQQVVEQDIRLKLDVRTERQMFADQIKDTANVILYLGWPLAIILGVGALIGILNIMLIAIEARMNSLRIVGLLGFSPFAVIVSIVFETILLAFIGALIGTTIMYLLLDGAAAWAVTGGIDTEVYNLRLGLSTFSQSIGFAVLLGLLGGVIPAMKVVNQESAKPC